MTELSIEAVAERMGISKHALRYYEREGLLREIAKGPNGHRRYTDDDLGWIRFLQLLRGTGMPIREMKQFVELTHAGDHTIAERVEVLKRYRVSLAARMEADRESMRFLEGKIDYYSGVLEIEHATPEMLGR
jgi:DNA-binding transcriptional MerR regulator